MIAHWGNWGAVLSDVVILASHLVLAFLYRDIFRKPYKKGVEAMKKAEDYLAPIEKLALTESWRGYQRFQIRAFYDGLSWWDLWWLVVAPMVMFWFGLVAPVVDVLNLTASLSGFEDYTQAREVGILVKDLPEEPEAESK